jgi:hypothetical protein
MNGRFTRASIAAGPLLVLLAVAATAGNTYINNFANVQVTEPDRREFTIHVDQASHSSAILMLCHGENNVYRTRHVQAQLFKMSHCVSLSGVIYIPQWSMLLSYTDSPQSKGKKSR